MKLKLVWAACLVLTACLPFPEFTEEPPTGSFGPVSSIQEVRVRTFDNIWDRIEQDYIHYDDANIDWDSLHTEYRDRFEEVTSQDQFIELMADLESDLPDGALAWQSRQERINEDITDSSTYEGIGAFIGFNPEPEAHIVILSVIEGSPADKAGLQAHDSIYSIDGEPILKEEGISAVDRIRGQTGSSVRLTVKSPDESVRTVNLQRAQLVSTVKLVATIDPETNIGYILFPPSGYENLVEDIGSSLEGMTSNRHLQGLVLDLRIAGSARGWPLEDLLTMFADGIIGEFFDRSSNQVVSIQGKDTLSSQSVPLAVLVGENTSGFPEIFAASLRVSKKALIFGAPTAGAVETATGSYLPDGSRLFIESASFRAIDGLDLGNAGLQPDVLIAADWDQVLPDNDPVMDAAQQALEESQ